MASATPSPKPEALARISPDKVVEVDARPVLKAGGEPFGVIMEGVQKTPADGALRLRATFRPAPLFTVLGSQGFSHWIEYGEGDDWIVWFYRESAAEAAQEAAADPEEFAPAIAALQKDYPLLRKRLSHEDGRWVLDVRRMSPPEPMELTLMVLEALPGGQTLLQINERVPQFLLPLLTQRGNAFTLDHIDESTVHVTIQTV